MTKLYRAVPAQGFDPKRLHRRLPTPRPPVNVPYVVDNLWEMLRPEGAPSRRHAAYGSPNPELALANASSSGADPTAYIACELVFHGQALVAQLDVTDARHHPDIRLLQKAALAALGDFQEQSLDHRILTSPIYLPALSSSHMKALTDREPAIAALVEKARAVSTFWKSASPTISDTSTGELFFELIGDAAYSLIPV